MATWDLDDVRHLVLVCTGSSCRKRGADRVLAALKAEVKEAGLRAEVHLARTRCLGRCDDACNVVHATDGCWYAGVGTKGARRIAREHLRDGAPVQELLAYDLSKGRIRKVGSGERGKPKG